VAVFAHRFSVFSITPDSALARFHPKEFARFSRISKSSRAEVMDRLRSAVLRRLVQQSEADRITALADRASGACTRLIQYLERSKGPQS
jgi:hypothetical protein